MKKRSSIKITKSVLFALILREVRGRLYARRFGAVWLLLEPIAHMLAMLALITVLRGRSVQGFEAPMFFVVGIAPFLMMRNICLRMMEAVNANAALFAYRQITPFDTMLARLVVEVAIFACVYTLIILGMGLFLGYDILIRYPMEWLGTLFVGIVFSFSIGIVLCVIAEAIPELKGFLRLLFMPLYFISGVLFPVWAIPHHLLDWIIWNPFLHIIDSLRWSIFEHYPTTPGIGMWYPLEVTVCSLFVALGVYRARRLRLVAI